MTYLFSISFMGKWIWKCVIQRCLVLLFLFIYLRCSLHLNSSLRLVWDPSWDPDENFFFTIKGDGKQNYLVGVVSSVHSSIIPEIAWSSLDLDIYVNIILSLDFISLTWRESHRHSAGSTWRSQSSHSRWTRNIQGCLWRDAPLQEMSITASFYLQANSQAQMSGK